MKVRHIGIVCRRETAAARFFGDLLGLKRRAPKGEGWLTFIEDDDGHRFELKQV